MKGGGLETLYLQVTDVWWVRFYKTILLRLHDSVSTTSRATDEDLRQGVCPNFVHTCGTFPSPERVDLLDCITPSHVLVF